MEPPTIDNANSLTNYNPENTKGFSHELRIQHTDDNLMFSSSMGHRVLQ